MSKKRTLKIGFGAVIGVLCLWMFLYVSTLFPYLGTASKGETKFPLGSVDASMPTIGTERMLLFKGQTAFIDYNVNSSDGGGVHFDVKPVMQFGFSDQTQVIRGNQSGRIEFEVKETGFYRFYHRFSLNGLSGSTSYSASWGAI
ncbi:MAG: hypothetical protein QNJ15_12365 [Erythrobacter sp.]|nr:hypothetical protein [Erythrobacter sp.]